MSEELIDRVWELLDIAVVTTKADNKIKRNEDARDQFAVAFQEKYNFIKNKFMQPSVKNLDRHKVASIIIATIIETDAIIYTDEIPNDHIFFGKYLIAVSVGLSYMQNALNKLLRKIKQKEIEKFWFPAPFSCSTSYFEIFSRNLYFTHELTDWKINLLDISENMFLIEYMNLEKNGIDPSILNVDSQTEY